MSKIKKVKILVVDESISVQKLFTLSFADGNFDVIVAQDFIDAVQKIKLLSPDIVFVDEKVGESSGLTLVERIRNDFSTIHVVLMTTNSPKPGENQLKKPFDSRDLKECVASLLSEESTVTRRETTTTFVLEEATQSTIIEKPSVSTSSTTTNTVTHRAPVTLDKMLEISESEVKKWIEGQLPAIAERLIKEEIERQTKNL